MGSETVASKESGSLNATKIFKLLGGAMLAGGVIEIIYGVADHNPDTIIDGVYLAALGAIERLGANAITKSTKGSQPNQAEY